MSRNCSPRSNQNCRCQQQCLDPDEEVEPVGQHRPLRFFIIVGVTTTVLVTLTVVLTCLYPGAVLPAIAAFLYVLGGRLLGKGGLP